jgi:peptide deformylase
MPLREVKLYPNDCLRKKAQTVEDFEDEEIAALVIDLQETCVAYQAQGLAAPQIGVDKRVFVINVGNEFRTYINPEITEREGTIESKEGCLSFPTINEVVKRSEDITIKAKNVVGEEFVVSADGVEAVAIQHENDHLDGVLFLDKVTPLKRRFALKKLAKLKKRYGVK